MGGGTIYCSICGGPPEVESEDLEAKPDDNDNNASFTKSDNQWLETVVVVYGDCLSPTGIYDQGMWSVLTYPADVDDDDDNDKKPLNDPINVPTWAAACQTGGSGRFFCYDHMDVFMTHETCIRLAAEWSRAIHPSRYGPNDTTDPSKFFWDSDNHPVSEFFYVSGGSAARRSEQDILDAYRQKSKATFEKLGEPSVSFAEVTDRMRETFFVGYDKGRRPDWLDGCEQCYSHEEEWGVTHLKRPDRFPNIHSLDESSSRVIPLSPLIDKGLPLDVVVHLFAEIDWNGSDIRNLESVSRAWRDFFHSPVMQHHFWFKRINCSLGRWNPTAGDWTQSAERVRQALKEANTVKIDWRRYYNDCGRSLNMENRGRIRQAVLQLEEAMGYDVKLDPFSS
ncbi:hypothetical protein C8J56DRAFT_852407 [Mycena floridula]|nr:hypothetical protein C8J56DRAFT_852407 [Mycena floridula]